MGPSKISSHGADGRLGEITAGLRKRFSSTKHHWRLSPHCHYLQQKDDHQSPRHHLLPVVSARKNFEERRIICSELSYGPFESCWHAQPYEENDQEKKKNSSDGNADYRPI
jgi:hypothetical protein